MAVRVQLLGTAQDAGVPQIGCSCPRCARARSNHRFRRRAVCLGVHAGERFFLVDAGPDLRDQLGDRRHLDGVLLTHAHLGHFTGLLQFGREAMGTRGLPVYCTPLMADFLRANAPWRLLIELENIELRILVPGVPEQLTEQLAVEPVHVPHRNEFADTVCFFFQGPRKRLLYLPDIDRWSEWNRPIEQVVTEVDIALLDGCFFSPAELVGRRDFREIPHPPIAQTVELLGEVAGRAAVYFIHMNHTNPVLSPDSPERAAVEGAGFRVGEENLEFLL